jgi:hypothetical protein
MVVSTEVVTMVSVAISEAAVDVAGDEEDGAMIAVTEAGMQSVITGLQEMTEDLHFGTIEAVIATDGRGTIVSEDAEHHLLKAVVVRPITDLVKPGMRRQPWIWTAPEEAQEMDLFQVAPQLLIHCSP